MAWYPWSRAEPPPEPPPPPKDDGTAPELDLNALFSQPPPNLTEPEPGDPKWMVTPEPAQEVLHSRRDEYTRVDLAKLRREREQREKGQRFWQRLRAGKVDARDIPGQAAAANSLLRLGELVFSPLRAIGENPGVVLAVLATAIGFAFATKGLMAVARHLVGSAGF